MSDYKEDTKSPRILVLCFDGTTNQYDTKNTNVVKFFSLLKKGNCDQQLCYYQPGVGTYFAPGVVSPLFQLGAQLLDDAFAWYLNTHVMDGYKFVMQNYRDGDKICIFGFSRGAYTARALAGMLYKVGLLPRDNQEQIPFAFKLYVREDKVGEELCAGFKKTYCQNVGIEFLGVWDTVASVGMVATKTLPFTNSNGSIKTFRHALALDEHRARFRPNLFHREPLKDPNATKSRVSLPPYMSESEDSPTDLLEVWFAGCHSDVGGGAVKNTTKHSLANIALRWMIKQVVKSECGIIFDDEALSDLNISMGGAPPSSGSSATDLCAGHEWRELDKVDAIQPLHDDLASHKLWWIVELFTLRYTWQDIQGVWHTSYRWNRGRGRKIETEPYLHVTVEERMADPFLSYKPKAIW